MAGLLAAGGAGLGPGHQLGTWAGVTKGSLLEASERENCTFVIHPSIHTTSREIVRIF